MGHVIGIKLDTATQQALARCIEFRLEYLHQFGAFARKDEAGNVLHHTLTPDEQEKSAELNGLRSLVLHGTQIRNTGRRIGPNEKCPCESGRKYKKCHGAVAR